MRADEMFRLDPPWVPSLRRGLRTGAHAAPHIRGPADALEELMLVAQDAEAGRPPRSRADIRSLRADVVGGLEAVGPVLRRYLQPVTAQLRREFGHLDHICKHPPTAARLAVTARAALWLIGDPRAVTAAWDDVVSAWKDEAPPREHQSRLAVLENLLRTRGEDPEEVLDAVADVLINRGWGLLVTAHALGEAFETDADGHVVALGVEQRLDRSRRFIAHSWEPDSRVVWLAFTNAKSADQPRPRGQPRGQH